MGLYFKESYLFFIIMDILGAIKSWRKLENAILVGLRGGVSFLFESREQDYYNYQKSFEHIFMRYLNCSSPQFIRLLKIENNKVIIRMSNPLFNKHNEYKDVTFNAVIRRLISAKYKRVGFSEYLSIYNSI